MKTDNFIENLKSLNCYIDLLSYLEKCNHFTI